MIVLCFGMQGEDIIEHTNDKCHVFYIIKVPEERHYIGVDQFVGTTY